MGKIFLGFIYLGLCAGILLWPEPVPNLHAQYRGILRDAATNPYSHDVISYKDLVKDHLATRRQLRYLLVILAAIPFLMPFMKGGRQDESSREHTDPAETELGIG